MEYDAALNPFVIGKYISGEYFCDREKEKEFLVKQVINGRNTVLISPRRMGKTGLIEHCFNDSRLRNHYHLFFVDIYATSSLAEFVYLLGKNIYEELKPKTSTWKDLFFQTIKSLRVGFRLSSVTGEPVLDLGIGDIQEPQATLDEIFEYLENADLPCVVAIDEFQQIGVYAEKNVEALLRTKVQQCKNVSFVYSGSKRHLISNMFNSSSKPFYQSAICMDLEPIPKETYIEFSVNLFKGRGKGVEPALVEKVYKNFGGCTWFLQVMMNELFAMTPTGGECGSECYEEALNNIVTVQRGSYSELLARLTPRQRQVLIAIAKEGNAKNVTSSAFVSTYKLQSASSVQSALKPLLAYDIVTQHDGGMRVSDWFFAQWLRKY